MGDLEGYIEELKQLKELGILPQETKDEIDKAITLAENSQTNDNSGSFGVTIPVKFVNKSDFKNPVYAKDGDSGFDLRAMKGGTLNSLERMLVPTGLYFELPHGCELQIRPRSGLAYKHGITVLNTPGTVDTGYRGEVKVLLVNLSDTPFTWEKGERIAQGVIAHRVGSELADLIEVKEINETDRGEGGFGSTGTK
jgi:dUTP pyrophosphatase